MAIDIQDIINKKTNHLLELLKQKKDVVKEEEPNEQPHEEEYGKENDTPIIIEEKTPMTDIVLQKIEKILDLLREKKNKNDNVKTLVETSLSVLLSLLNNQGKQSTTFPELAIAILNGDDIGKPIEINKIPISSEKIPLYADLAAEFFSSILGIVEDNIARDEIKKAIELVEALKLQEITTSNIEELVDISTKILEEIANTVSQIPGAPVVQPGVQTGVQPGAPVVQPPGAPVVQPPGVSVVQPPGVQPGVQPVVQPPGAPVVQTGIPVVQTPGAPVVQPGVQAPASTYYNSMIHKNSDIGTFLAAAIGNALVDKKPNRIDNILSKLMKTGTIFKSVFKGIDMKAMSQRLSSLSLQSGTTPNVNPSSPFGSMHIPTISLDATIDIFKLTIGFPFAFIKYCAEQGIKLPQTIIDTFKKKVATTLDPNSVTDTTQDKNNITNMDAETNKSAIDTPQKEVNCSDPNVIKLGQVEDTALCFDPKQNKVIATK
jgi:hypothetical protein